MMTTWMKAAGKDGMMDLKLTVLMTVIMISKQTFTLRKPVHNIALNKAVKKSSNTC